MKRLFSRLILVLVVFLSYKTEKREKKVWQLNPVNEYYSFQGRIDVSDSGEALLIGPASDVHFLISGDSVIVHLVAINAKVH